MTPLFPVHPTESSALTFVIFLSVSGCSVSKCTTTLILEDRFYCCLAFGFSGVVFVCLFVLQPVCCSSLPINTFLFKGKSDYRLQALIDSYGKKKE
jgi:hypothetical protein